MPDDLLYHFVGAANQQRALRASLCIEPGTRDGRPSALLPHISECLGVPRKEVIRCLLRRRRDVAQRMHADFQLICRESKALTRFPVEIDQRPEAPRLATDDGHH